MQGANCLRIEGRPPVGTQICREWVEWVAKCRHTCWACPASTIATTTCPLSSFYHCYYCLCTCPASTIDTITCLLVQLLPLLYTITCPATISHIYFYNYPQTFIFASTTPCYPTTADAPTTCPTTKTSTTTIPTSTSTAKCPAFTPFASISTFPSFIIATPTTCQATATYSSATTIATCKYVMSSLHYYIPCTQQWSWFWLLVGLFEGRIFMLPPSCPPPPPAAGTHRLSCLHIAPPPDRSPGQPEQMQLKQAAQPTEMYTWCMTSMTSSKKLEIWMKENIMSYLHILCSSWSNITSKWTDATQASCWASNGDVSLMHDKQVSPRPNLKTALAPTLSAIAPSSRSTTMSKWTDATQASCWAVGKHPSSQTRTLELCL